MKPTLPWSAVYAWRLALGGGQLISRRGKCPWRHRGPEAQEQQYPLASVSVGVNKMEEPSGSCLPQVTWRLIRVCGNSELNPGSLEVWITHPAMLGVKLSVVLCLKGGLI